jgi:hypothetical protein
MKITGAPRVIISPHHQAAPRGGRQLIEPDNEINELETDETKYAKMESWICRNVGSVLTAKYPGRAWRVDVNLERGVLVIQLPLLSTEKGYYVHLADRTIHQLQARSLQAAGEILERFGLSRNRECNQDHAEALPRQRLSPDEAIGPDSNATSITGSGKVLKDGQV